MNMTMISTTTESLLDGVADDGDGLPAGDAGVGTQATRDFSEGTTGPTPHSLRC